MILDSINIVEDIKLCNVDDIWKHEYDLPNNANMHSIGDVLKKLNIKSEMDIATISFEFNIDAKNIKNVPNGIKWINFCDYGDKDMYHYFGIIHYEQQDYTRYRSDYSQFELNGKLLILDCSYFSFEESHNILFRTLINL